MLSFTLFLSVLSTVKAVTQLPASETPLSLLQLERFDPYAQFAKATYCSTWSLSDWKCGRMSGYSDYVLRPMLYFRCMFCVAWI